MLCMILVSCTGQKTGKENDNNDKIAIEVGEIKFPPQDVLQLRKPPANHQTTVPQRHRIQSYKKNVQ